MRKGRKSYGQTHRDHSIPNDDDAGLTWNRKSDTERTNSLRYYGPQKITTPTLYKKSHHNSPSQLNKNLRKIGVVGVNDLPADHFSLTYGLIEYHNLNFLITDRPAKANIMCYVEDLLGHNVKQVIRVCESDYPTEELTQRGILVTDYPFDDGFPPPQNIIVSFLQNIKAQFENYPDSKIAIHCVAGLGRAPVMVAIALMEAGMNYMDAVDYIRHKRRGAINLRQLEFLENYKSSYFLRPKRTTRSCQLL